MSRGGGALSMRLKVTPYDPAGAPHMMTTDKDSPHLRRSVLWIALLAGFLLASCDGGGPTVSASAQPGVLRILSAPTLTANPNTDVPLVGILNVQTDRLTRVVLDVSGGADKWFIPLNDYQTQRTTPVVGFRPNTSHTVQVTLLDQQGTAVKVASPLNFTTGPLPANFPPFSVVVSDPAKMEPGLTLLEPFVPPNISYLAAIDARGNVVWYCQSSRVPGRALDARRLSNGNITFITPDFVEITTAGDIVTHLYASTNPGAPPPASGGTPIAISGLHHEVSPLPSGHFVGLTQEVRVYSNYPASETDLTQTSATASVLADIVVEFDRNGTVVHSWKLLDMLDPYRIGYGSLGVDRTGAKDWSHSNAIVYDPNSDAFILSVRHQDVVIKFRRNLASTGKPSDLVWMLGDPQGWGPTWQPYLLKSTNFPYWQYHQHAAMVMANGDILMHDNGNFRAVPPTPLTPENMLSSRAVQYHVDEAKMEVTQVWEYGSPASAPLPVFSSALGDADEMPQTGNVLSDYGLISFLGGVPTSRLVSRVLETSRTGEVVFRLDIGINDPDPAVGVTVQNYRADRVPTFNP